jgi:hypothetical protein
MAASTTTGTKPATPSKTEVAYNADPAFNGVTLTFGEIEALWIKANPTQAAWAPLMAGIAEAESGGRTGALNDAGTTTGSSADYSVGLWQINYLGSLLSGRTAEYGSPGYLQQNPLAQAQAAGALLGNGAGIRNWEGDPVGQYFMSSGTAPTLASVLSVVNQKGYDTTDAANPPNLTAVELTSWTSDASGEAGALGQSIAGASELGGVLNAAGGVTSTISGLSKIESDLTNKQWWIRVGEFAGGVALVVGGIAILITTSKTGQEIKADAPDLALAAAA